MNIEGFTNKTRNRCCITVKSK